MFSQMPSNEDFCHMVIFNLILTHLLILKINTDYSYLKRIVERIITFYNSLHGGFESYICVRGMCANVEHKRQHFTINIEITC